MGARGVGHLARTCARSRRRTSRVVLNVGTAHLGEFGVADNIARAKGELVEALGADGVAVLNADDPLVAAMAARTRRRVVHVRHARRCRRPGRVTSSSTTSAGPSFDLVARTASPSTVALRLLGEHQAVNAAAVAAVALAAVGLSSSTPSRAPAHGRARCPALADGGARARRRRDRRQRRLQRQPRLDAGRARDAGARSAARAGRRTVAVLGEMRELGDDVAEPSTRRRRAGAAASGSTGCVVVGEGARADLRRAHAGPAAPPSRPST